MLSLFKRKKRYKVFQIHYRDKQNNTRWKQIVARGYMKADEGKDLIFYGVKGQVDHYCLFDTSSIISLKEKPCV